MRGGAARQSGGQWSVGSWLSKPPSWKSWEEEKEEEEEEELKEEEELEEEELEEEELEEELEEKLEKKN